MEVIICYMKKLNNEDITQIIKLIFKIYFSFLCVLQVFVPVYSGNLKFMYQLTTFRILFEFLHRNYLKLEKQHMLYRKLNNSEK